MNDSLSEMQSFETEPFKIDFNQPPNLIQKAILKLPLEEQQYWIDLWMAQPAVITDLDGKVKRQQEAYKVPPPINTKNNVMPPDQHWQD